MSYVLALSSNIIMKNRCLVLMYFPVFFDEFFIETSCVIYLIYFVALFEFSDESAFLAF